MDVPEYLYAARKEQGPTPQLAKDFEHAFGLLYTVLCQKCQWTGSGRISAVRPVLSALGIGHITMMADTFRRFRTRPSFMVEHPAFDFFWAFLLPGGTALIPEACDAIRVVASSLAVHAYLDDAQAEEIVAITLGAPTFEALMNGSTMPTDPLIDLHGPARRSWQVFTMHPEVDELEYLRTLAPQPGRVRADLEDIVRRNCTILVNAAANRENCRLDQHDDVYAGEVLRGRCAPQTPEVHARVWSLGGSNGHLDALLLGGEDEGKFVAWLSAAIQAFKEDGVPLPLSVTVEPRRAEGEPLPACVPVAGDVRQYQPEALNL
ncbi:hypothetical protein EVC45_38220 [Paraburkholderia sp. UYCP14C]|uniref:hypothetical protein n=1 Tax=Paraburkholderia sp. UYCP14C TaxID=2511130 RepID=UPI00101F9BF8|nr:hypothetical protein [Paraburkholderia sp. UYCP14C]RZF24572.1 hypothetical protein EVC45_38220 [Paraburkholderia sp. UYCP14C]